MADNDDAQREVTAKALSGELDEFVLAKAAARASLGLVINAMLDSWRTLPEAKLKRLQDALVATLSELTAECALGMRVPTKEQFLQFMEHAYDRAADEQGPAP